MSISSQLEETLLSEHKSDSLKPSVDDPKTHIESAPPLLPRSAWNSQVTFLRAIFRAKRALDRIEQEADVTISSDSTLR